MLLQDPVDLLPENQRNLALEWRPCTRCPLHEGIFHYVFYRGHSPCQVLFIGEAPGKQENLSGIPFVGRAGDLLNDIIASTNMDFTYGIMNVLACAPFTKDKISGKIGVRPPTLEEANACRPRFLETIYRANPGLIVLLGTTAKKFLKLPNDLTHISVLELKHPAYMLRKGGRKCLDFERSVLYLQEALEDLI